MTTNNSYPLVTIGIPTYNRADKFLRQTLESALQQTYSQIEIVVSDNCSTDNTERLVKSFNDTRIRYFRQITNIGAINNSNFCLAKAKGVYFMLLHDDDMIDHDFIESCMKSSHYATDIGIIRTGTRVINSDNKILQESYNTAEGLSTTEFFRNWFACKFSIYLCSTLFNTKQLNVIGGFKSRHNLFDDLVTYAKLSEFKRIDIKDIKASFQKHGNEETFTAKISDWCEDSIYLLDIICKFVSDNKRTIVKKEGEQFLSIINYQFASTVKSWPRRIMAYFTVYKAFGCNHIPPPLKSFLYHNPLTNGLRFIKNKATGLSTE